jgi:hypothetical protein
VQGRVGVLLRLHDPDDQVGERHDPVDLEPVGAFDGVEVRQVEKREAAECPGVDPVTASDLEPVEEWIGAVAPDRRLALRGRRAAATDRRQLGPGQHVEEQRLADARRPRKRHDGVLDAETEPHTGLPSHRSRCLHGFWLEPAVRHLDRFRERGQPAVEIPAHEARLTASIAACKREKPSASVAAPSIRASKRFASSRST